MHVKEAIEVFKSLLIDAVKLNIDESTDVYWAHTFSIGYRKLEKTLTFRFLDTKKERRVNMSPNSKIKLVFEAAIIQNTMQLSTMGEHIHRHVYTLHTLYAQVYTLARYHWKEKTTLHDTDRPHTAIEFRKSWRRCKQKKVKTHWMKTALSVWSNL